MCVTIIISILLVLASLLMLVSTESIERERREVFINQTADCYQVQDMPGDGWYSDVWYDLLDLCASGGSMYPNNARWALLFSMPASTDTRYVNVAYEIDVENHSTCLYDKLIFGSNLPYNRRIELCGNHTGEFSVNVTGDNFYAVNFTSDSIINGTCVKFQITYSSTSRYRTWDLPRYNSPYGSAAAEPVLTTPYHPYFASTPSTQLSAAHVDEGEVVEQQLQWSVQQLLTVVQGLVTTLRESQQQHQLYHPQPFPYYDTLGGKKKK